MHAWNSFHRSAALLTSLLLSGTGAFAQSSNPTDAPRSMRLAWVAPLSNADGTPLADLAGFRVKLGTASGAYDRIVRVDDPHTLSTTVTGLTPGSYYVVVTAVDASNNESAPSREIVKVVR